MNRNAFFLALLMPFIFNRGKNWNKFFMWSLLRKGIWGKKNLKVIFFLSWNLVLSKCLKISGSPVSKNNYSQPSGCCGSFHFICSKERGILPNPQMYKSTLISFSSHFFSALDLQGFLTQRFSSSVGRQPFFFFFFFFRRAFWVILDESNFGSCYYVGFLVTVQFWFPL